jgi:hypothetical protein
LATLEATLIGAFVATFQAALLATLEATLIGAFVATLEATFTATLAATLGPRQSDWALTLKKLLF